MKRRTIRMLATSLIAPTALAFVVVGGARS